LVHHPVVLVADELTGELDEATTESVLDLLDVVRRSQGTTILTVTHNPRVAERARHRLVMRDGTLLESA
ncbi:MAG: hypothetical protein ABIW17_04495, partial [Marmoricola sp.]